MKVINPARIVSRRKCLGYTQVDLAHLVGCTQQYISLIERGENRECSEAIALKLARRLAIDLDEAFEERSPGVDTA